MKFSRWRRQNLKVAIYDFKIWVISQQISKSPSQIWNAPSIPFSYLQMIITSSLQFMHYLQYCTPNFSRFKTIYNLPKIELGKFFKVHLKLEVNVVIKSWTPIPILNFKLWPLTFFSRVYLPSIFLFNLHLSSLMLCLFPFAFSKALIMLHSS